MLLMPRVFKFHAAKGLLLVSGEDAALVAANGWMSFMKKTLRDSVDSRVYSRYKFIQLVDKKKGFRVSLFIIWVMIKETAGLLLVSGEDAALVAANGWMSFMKKTLRDSVDSRVYSRHKFIQLVDKKKGFRVSLFIIWVMIKEAAGLM
nr:hypothetical protein [Tanacetum cinerariifolium]